MAGLYEVDVGRHGPAAGVRMPSAARGQGADVIPRGRRSTFFFCWGAEPAPRRLTPLQNARSFVLSSHVAQQGVPGTFRILYSPAAVLLPVSRIAVQDEKLEHVSTQKALIVARGGSSIEFYNPETASRKCEGAREELNNCCH
jgi:hypothetical protein